MSSFPVFPLSPDLLVTRIVRGTPAAKFYFDIVKKRLIHVGQWHKLHGLGAYSFLLPDQPDRAQRLPVQQGQSLRLTFHPSRKTKTKAQHYWIRIDEIEESDESSNSTEKMSLRICSFPPRLFRIPVYTTLLIQRVDHLIIAKMHRFSPFIAPANRVSLRKGISNTPLFASFWKPLLQAIMPLQG